MDSQCFLKYFDNWKISVANSLQVNGQICSSVDRHKGLQITCLSVIEVAKYLLTTGGCKYFLPERLNQDKAENYFGI